MSLQYKTKYAQTQKKRESNQEQIPIQISKNNEKSQRKIEH